MAAGGEALTSSAYIKHHLQNLTLGFHPEKGLGIAHGPEEAREMGFLAIHLDTMFWSVGLGALFLYLFHKVAVRATSGVPGGWQNFVEWTVEFIDTNVRGTFSSKNDLVAPIALTLFVWVLLQNTMDLVPVDWIPELAKLIGIPYMKVVPTTDPNATFGMALSVFALMLYYSVRIKGIGGFFGELAFQPFPKWMFPRQPAAGGREPDIEAGLPVAAPLRQPLRGGDDLHPDRAALQRGMGARRSRRRAPVGMGGVPRPHRAAAGLHFHDSDRRLPGHGASAPLSADRNFPLSRKQE